MDSSEQEHADLVLVRLTGSDYALDMALADHRRGLEARELAPQTASAYGKDMRHFIAWLSAHGADVAALDTPAKVSAALLLYLDTYLYNPDPERRLLPSTIERRLSGLRHEFRRRRLPWPDEEHLRIAIRVARRELGAPPKQATAISVPLLRQMVNMCPDSNKGLRDRALLLLGFCAALRRSELTSLEWSHISFDPAGVRVLVARSKSDQNGAGRSIYLPLGKHSATCPVGALRAWQNVAKADTGPVFRSVSKSGTIRSTRLTPDVVDRLVRTYASQAQPGPRYSAHSLRAGLATAAAQAGADDRTIMATTGHRSRTTLDGYVRIGRGYVNSAMTYIDL